MIGAMAREGRRLVVLRPMMAGKNGESSEREERGRRKGIWAAVEKKRVRSRGCAFVGGCWPEQLTKRWSEMEGTKRMALVVRRRDEATAVMLLAGEKNNEEGTGSGYVRRWFDDRR